MTYAEYRDILYLDRKQYSENLGHISLYISNSGYKIVTHLRRCELLRSKRILHLLYIVERLYYHHLCVKYGCDIPSHVKIGAGFKIDHPVGIVINSHVEIGTNCNIKTGTVIGKTDKGVAVIGKNVLLGAHSLIIGPVNIGDNAHVGAGAIVVHDVPKCAIVVCSSAHLLA